MDFKHLIYFIAIAEEQNLTRASKRLYVSQSTLSLYLSKLEKDLGVQLFHKVKNRLVITEAGKMYKETALQILALRDDLYKRIHATSPVTSIHIGIASQMVMRAFSRLLLESKQDFPTLNIQVTEGRTYAMLEALHNRTLDMAIFAYERILEDSLLTVRLIKKEEMILVLPDDPQYAEIASKDCENPPIADMSLFRGCTFTTNPRSTCDYRITANIFQDYNMNAKIIGEFNDSTLHYKMISQKRCFMFAPQYTLPRDQHFYFCKPDKPYYRYMQLGTHKDYRISADGQALIDRLLDVYFHYYV